MANSAASEVGIHTSGNRGTHPPRRPTTACSDLDHHKMHAPDCHGKFELSDRAPSVGRPVADAGRSVT